MWNSDALVLAFPDQQAPAGALARRLGLPFDAVYRHVFPDGERLVRLPERLPPTVILVRSLDRPDHKLVELLLAARTARELGAERLILVAPYLCYMRQDAAFHRGEAVSQRVVGAFLADLVDALVTVDPHLHRVRRLEAAVPVEQGRVLHATGPMAEFLAGRPDRPLLVGPDAESEQWVKALAETGGLEHAVATKTRLGDHEVEIRLPDVDVAGRPIVLVDDVASSGTTLATVTRLLRERGAGPIDALVTHALFADDAEARVHGAGVRHLWSTDSIPHPSNLIPLDGLIAPAVAELLGRP